MMFKKKLMVTAAALLAAAALIAGCGEDGSGGGGKAEPKGTPIPPRAEVKTSPMTTFKFGDKEAKVYEIQNIDIKGLNAYRLAAVDDTVYMLAESQGGLIKIGKNKKTVLKLDIKDEKVQNTSIIGDWINNDSLRATDKGALWFEFVNKNAKENLYAFYDGKETKSSLKSPFGATSYEFKRGTTDIYYKGGYGDIKHAKYENGELKSLEPVLKKDVLEKAIGDSFTGIIKGVDEKYFYLIRVAEIDKTKDKEKVPQMHVIKHDGTLAYSLVGVKELPRDWAITTNYIMHAGSKGDVAIFNKDDGKLIATTQIPNARIFKLSTARGNDVYATDDRNKKLYRIDL